MEINEEDVYRSFYEFYHKGSNKVDMLRDKSTAGFEKWDGSKYLKLAKENPIKFLIKTHGDFFVELTNGMIRLVWGLENIIENIDFVIHMKDAIDYRNDRYYEERSFSNDIK